MLLDKPLESHPLEPNVELPPPSLLKRKIIIKNKKKHHHHHHHHHHKKSSQNNLNNSNTGKPIDKFRLSHKFARTISLDWHSCLNFAFSYLFPM